MKRIVIVALALGVVAMWAVAGSEHSEHSGTKPMMTQQKPRLVAVLFYADWCSKCKELEPKLKAVEKDFAGKGVLFTRFDLTDDFTQEQSLLFASWVGFDKLLKDYEGTGFVLLVDPQSKKVLAEITSDHSPESIKDTISEALASLPAKSGMMPGMMQGVMQGK